MTDRSLDELSGQIYARALTRTSDYAAWRDDWPSFRTIVEQAHRAHPEHAEAAQLFGRKLARDGEYRAALEVLQPAWERDHMTWAGITIAWCLDYLGHREEAIRMYARMAAVRFLTDTQHAIVAAGIEEPQRPKQAPKAPRGVVEVKSAGWSGTASHEQLPPAHGIDRDTHTAWSPMGDHQTPGMWYRIDLGEEVEGLAGIWTDDDAGGESIYQNAAPRHCLVSVSRDGEWWKRVGEWRWSPNRYMEAWWEPISARYVLMEQTEYCHPEWWCIYEAHVFAAGRADSK